VGFDEGLIGEVMRTGEAQYKNNFPEWEHRESVFDEDNLIDFMKNVIALPVKKDGKVIGIIGISDSSNQRPFSRDDVDLLERFAHPASIAIQNASLVEQERISRQQAETLREVSDVISSNLEMADVAGKILDELAKVVEFRKATIQLIRGDERTLLAFRGFRREAIDEWLLRPISQDRLVTRIVVGKEPLILSDSQRDPDWEIRPWTEDVRSWVGVPLVYGEETLGLLTLDHDQIGFYNQAHKDLLVPFANQAAIAVQNSRLFEDAQRRIRDLEMMNNVVQAISTEFDTELLQLLQAVVSQIAENLNCTHCTFFLSQEENNELVLVPQVSWGPLSERAMSRRFRPGEGLAGWVFEHGESVMLADAREDDRFSPARTKENPPRSMLVAPVQIREQTIGVICADQDKYGWFDKNDQQLLDALARRIGIAIERDGLRKAQIDAVRREYVLDVAHQLIGPLSGLRAHAENLLEGRLTVERGRTVLKTLVEQAGLLQRYAENFAYAARSGHSIFSSTEFRPQRHDSRRLVDLLIKYAKSFQGQAQAKEIKGPSVDEVSFRGFPPLMLDENLFETLMLNLYDNAVKYSYESSEVSRNHARILNGHDETAPVIITGRVLDTEVEIEVTNHGIPLYPEDIPLIFQRDYRTKAAEEHAVLGTGIGLFICDQIARLHGGTIRALPSKRSLYGNEVKFVVTLPIAKT
jgi:GAF domain-containing protein